MSGRNDRTPNGRDGLERGRHSSAARAYTDGRRFQWNAVHIGIIAVVLVAGVVIGAVLLSPKNDTGAPPPAAAGAAQQPATPTPGISSSVRSTPAATRVLDEGILTETTAAPGSDASGAVGQYFTSGGVQADDTTYRSADLYVKITNINENGVNYYVADCRMKDGGKLFTALAGDKYELHQGEKTSAMANRKGAVVAINGDYYGYRPGGIVLRNGTLYRKTPYWDVAVLYGDGTMRTLDKASADADRLKADGAEQIFSFGPMLLDADGKAFSEPEMKKRQPKVNPANPRTGIGYIEPNHFVLVVADGRGAGGSRGLTQTEFSKLFESLGCKSAYNFDGGGSATMVFMGRVINHPCDEGGERSVSDILYFGESETDRANVDRINQR